MINEGGVASQTLYVVTHSHSHTHNFGNLYINIISLRAIKRVYINQKQIRFYFLNNITVNKATILTFKLLPKTR